MPTPPPAPPSRIRLDVVEGITVVQFVDSVIIDDTQIREIRDELYHLCVRLKHPRILLNFGNVKRYATQLLGNLLGLQKRIVDARGRLAFCSITPNLLEAIKILHLERVFEIYDDEQKAIDSF